MNKLQLPIAGPHFLILATLCLSSSLSITPALCAVPISNDKISQVDITHSFAERSFNTRAIGFTNRNTVVFVTVEDISRSKGSIFQRNVETGKVTIQLPLSSVIDPYKLLLSPDGKILITRQNISDISKHLRETHQIKILSSTDISNIKTIDLGEGNDISGMSFLNSSNERIIVQLISAIPFKKDDFIYGHDRFIILNLETGKTEKTIPYSHARGVNKPLFSPGGKYLACLFLGDDKADRLGILDVLDPETGKILWHLEGSEKQPIGGPFFFISPTKFVSRSMIYDISTKTSTPLIPEDDPRLECLTGVPGHTGYAFFMTKGGLELWNIKTKQALHRWPTLTQNGFIQMAPDLKTFSYQQDQNIQFWAFDPAWLK